MFCFTSSSFLGVLFACFSLQAGRGPEKIVLDDAARAAEFSADARVQPLATQDSTTTQDTVATALPLNAVETQDEHSDTEDGSQAALMLAAQKPPTDDAQDTRSPDLLYFVIENPPLGTRLGHYLGYEGLDALRMVCKDFAAHFARSAEWLNSQGETVTGPAPLYSMFARAQAIHFGPSLLMPTQEDLESDSPSRFTPVEQSLLAAALVPFPNKLAAARFFRLWKKHNFDPRMIRAQLPPGTKGVATYTKLYWGDQPSSMPSFDTLVYGKDVVAVRSIPHDDALDNRLALSAVCPLGAFWRNIVFSALPEAAHCLFPPDSVFWPMRKRIHETNEEFARIEEKRKNLPTDDRLKPLNQVVYDALMQAGDVASRETGATGRTLRQLRLLKLRSPAMPLAKVEPALSELSRYISLLDSDFVWVTDTHKGPYSLASLALLRGLPDILRVLCSADVQAALVDAAAQLSDPSGSTGTGCAGPA